MTMIVERFLRWARTAPVYRRVEAADALARSFLLSPMDSGERDQVEAAMTALLDDSALEVRRSLAVNLAASEQAPHHIILSLAADRPVVAAIVAEQSPLILDSELVDMLASGDELIQCAIARRPFVSRSVAAAISEIACAPACLALLTNSGARMPRFSLDRVVERHGDDPELRLTLLQRDDLPLEIRRILLARLTASLRELVVGNEWMTPERADAVIRDARERATIASSFEAPADNMPALAGELIAAGELTPAFLLRAVVSGQALLFETALAALSGVQQRRVRALITSGRVAGLRAILDKAGLPAKIQPAFVAAVDVIRSEAAASDASSEYRRATRLIDAVLERYGRRPDREVDQILALLRRFAVEAKRASARGYVREMLEAA